MTVWNSVAGYKDGDKLDAKTMNQSISDLAQRTDYLYSELNAKRDSQASAIVIYNANISSDVTELSVVRYNAEIETYVLALSGLDYDTGDDLDSSYVAGIVLRVTGDNKADILVSGFIDYSNYGASVDAQSILQSGETFRPGPYYLSQLEEGKLTKQASNYLVYLGMFYAKNGNISGILLLPRVGQSGQGHLHRSVDLKVKPAGDTIVKEDGNGVRTVSVGLKADSNPSGDVTRLGLSGLWNYTGDVTYTIRLANADNNNIPSGFNDAYLYWESSDPLEGLGRVKLTSYESNVNIGSKGLVCYLEKPDDVNFSTIGADITSDLTTRTWTLNLPYDAQGWRSRRVSKLLKSENANFDVLVLNSGNNDKVLRSVRVIGGLVYQFDITEINDGDTFSIDFNGNVTVFRFSANDGEFDIKLNESKYANYRNLILKLNELGIYGTIDEEKDRVVLVLPLGCEFNGNTADDPGVIVKDYDNNTLISQASYSYLTDPDIIAFMPIALLNNLRLIFVPEYDSSGNQYSLQYDNTEFETMIFDEYPGFNFEYNISMHLALANYYPPVPINAATLVLNGVEMDKYTGNDGNDGVIAIGSKTIYWGKSTDQAPWHPSWHRLGTPGLDFPLWTQRFHYVLGDVGSTGIVSSLAPAPNSDVKIVACGTNDNASTGDLWLDFKPNFSINNANLKGYNVVKDVIGGRLRTGPVVEKIVAGPGISIMQQTNTPKGQGTVVVSLAEASIHQGNFEEIALDNAKQEMIGMFPYIRLLDPKQGIKTGFTAKFRVPHTILDTYYRVVLYATIFGTKSTSVLSQASLKFNYSILPDVTSIGPKPPTASLNIAQNLISPKSYINVNIPICNGIDAYTHYDPILIHNNTNDTDIPKHRYRVLGSMFPNPVDVPDWAGSNNNLGVRPGSIVAIRFDNNESKSNQYDGSLGFISLRWTLVPIGDLNG